MKHFRQIVRSAKVRRSPQQSIYNRRAGEFDDKGDLNQCLNLFAPVAG